MKNLLFWEQRAKRLLASLEMTEVDVEIEHLGDTLGRGIPIHGIAYRSSITLQVDALGCAEEIFDFCLLHEIAHIKNGDYDRCRSDVIKREEKAWIRAQKMLKSLGMRLSKKQKDFRNYCLDSYKKAYKEAYKKRR